MRKSDGMDAGQSLSPVLLGALQADRSRPVDLRELPHTDRSTGLGPLQRKGLTPAPSATDHGVPVRTRRIGALEMAELHATESKHRQRIAFDQLRKTSPTEQVRARMSRRREDGTEHDEI